jgi:hypothetical protein
MTLKHGHFLPYLLKIKKSGQIVLNCPEWYSTDIALEICILKVKKYANVLSLNYSFRFKAKNYFFIRFEI